jgi:Flp pilus assembly pilin Flp
VDWRGPERRRSPRPAGKPTYIVENDAPEWRPPVPSWERWTKRALAKSRHTVDAYPDHDEPFPDLRPLPVPEPTQRPPPPRHGDIFLMIVGRRHAKLVDLSGAHLDRLDLGRRLTQAWVLARIAEVVDDVLALDNESDKGQGLVEYALILALVAIVVIAGLLFLSGQIDAVLRAVGNSIPQQ